MLLCDGCDKECHTFCQYPILWMIPDTEWFCPICRQVLYTLYMNIQRLQSICTCKIVHDTLLAWWACALVQMYMCTQCLFVSCSFLSYFTLPCFVNWFHSYSHEFTCTWLYICLCVLACCLYSILMYFAYDVHYIWCTCAVHVCDM